MADQPTVRTDVESSNACRRPSTQSVVSLPSDVDRRVTTLRHAITYDLGWGWHWGFVPSGATYFPCLIATKKKQSTGGAGWFVT